MKLLFDNTHPKITLENYGLGGGFTKWGTTESLKLSYFGNRIGYSKSLAIVDIAGVVMQKCASLGVSLFFPPSLSQLIDVTSDLNIGTYSLSALLYKGLYTGKREAKEEHDIVDFRIDAGVLPACALIMAGVGVSAFSAHRLAALLGPVSLLKERIMACSGLARFWPPQL